MIQSVLFDGHSLNMLKDDSYRSQPRLGTKSMFQACWHAMIMTLPSNTLCSDGAGSECECQDY